MGGGESRGPGTELGKGDSDLLEKKHNKFRRILSETAPSLAPFLRPYTFGSHRWNLVDLLVPSCGAGIGGGSGRLVGAKSGEASNVDVDLLVFDVCDFLCPLVSVSRGRKLSPFDLISITRRHD